MTLEGAGHSITIKAEDVEDFLDAFAQEWRNRAEQALEEDENEETTGNKWCKYHGCWCEDVEEITEHQYDCDLECEDCDDLMYVK